MTNETLAILGSAASAVFIAGGVYAAMQIRTRKNATDINGVSRKVDAASARDNRRWMLQIAGEVEQLEPSGKAARIAQRLRSDVGVE